MKKFFLCIVCAVLFLASCERTVPVNKVSVYPSSVTMSLGDIFKLKGIVSPANASDTTLVWSSGNEKIATVNQKGEVVAAGVGEVSITARSREGGLTAKCDVTVTLAMAGLVWASNEKNIDAIEMSKGSSKTLEVKFFPNDATNRTVKWSSSNLDVATVGSSGNVEAKAAGHATIVATTADGGFSITCEVTVIERASSITLSDTLIVMKEYEQKLLSATIEPSDATDKTLLWTSTDDSVASVPASYGIVTAKQAGECDIIVTTSESFAARCHVVVNCPVSSIDLSEHSLVLNKDDSHTLTAKVLPSRASNQRVLWTSKDASVATVDSAGVVKALKKGSTEIVATSADNESVTASCMLTVNLPVSTIAIDPGNLDLYVGDVSKLKAILTPEDPSNPGVNWLSGNSQVVSVDSYGNVRANAFGKAQVFASSKDGGAPAYCNISVYRHVDEVVLSFDGRQLTYDDVIPVYTGTRFEIKTELLPRGEILNDMVNWTISGDGNVLMREDNGFVANSPGRVTVTAVSEDYEKKASCDVLVGDHVESVSVSPQSIIKDFYIGDTRVLEAKVSPGTVLDPFVSWEAESESESESESGLDVVTITSQDGGKATIKANSAGKARVYAISSDGKKSGHCEIVVFSHINSMDIYNKNKDRLTGNTIDITVGDCDVLSVDFNPSNFHDKTVSWSSSKLAVVSVNDKGEIEAKTAGKAVITATNKADGDHSASVTYVVHPKVASVKLDKKSAEMEVGDKVALNATVGPSDALDKSLEWTSSKLFVASVEGGTVTALKAGETEIVVTSKSNREISDTCKITVKSKAVPVTSVSFGDMTSHTFTKIGETLQLKATVLPDNADKSLIFTTSKPTVATVDPNTGLVTAVADGKATITAASVSYPDKTATCEITVNTNTVSVTSVSFDGKTSHRFRTIGATLTLSPIVLPADATDKSLKFSSSNESVAKVDPDKGIVTAVADGKATITATSVSNRTQSATFDVAVATVPVTGVQIYAKDAPIKNVTLHPGESMDFEAIVSPSNASDKGIKWRRTVTPSAALEIFGNKCTVKALGISKTTIVLFATSEDDESIETSCQITIQPIELQTLGLNITSKAARVGDKFELYPVFTPENVSKRTVAWTVDNPAVVSVNANGIVSCLSEGEAVISCIWSNSGVTKKETCKVKVLPRDIPGGGSDNLDFDPWN